MLSYGNSWQLPGWTDDSHKIELLWIGATHELVAFYITYDWDRLQPRARSTGTPRWPRVWTSRSTPASVSGARCATSTWPRRRSTSRCSGTLESDLACHELLWGWHWWQHHADGLDHVRERIREHAH